MVGALQELEKEPNWGDAYMVGFSDTCSLLLSKYSRGKKGSIHGPMISSFSKEPNWSLERLRNLLFEGSIDDIQGIPLKKGIAKGEIIVANLTIATFLIGTDHFPDLRGKIIIFEDINEDIYKIDRMLLSQDDQNIIWVAGIDSEVFWDICTSEWKNLLKDLV